MSTQPTRVAPLLPWTPVSLLLILLYLMISPPTPEAIAQAPASDVRAAIAKDENPGDGIPWDLGIDNDADTLVDEDPTADGVDDDGDGIDGEDPAVDVVKAGEPQLIPVRVTFTGGALSDDLNLTLSIAGPSACDPRWVSHGEALSVTVLGTLQLSRLTWPSEQFTASEELVMLRSYSVACQPGTHHFNVYAQAVSASGIDDPAPLNNLAENQLFVTATGDVDDDGISNESDGCDWLPDPGQDTDRDGAADSCDVDDDGDDFSDGIEMFVGTDPLRPCASTPLPDDEHGPDTWPPDFGDDGLVTISDALVIKPVILNLAPYSLRYDLDASGTVDIGDVGVIRRYIHQSCSAY